MQQSERGAQVRIVRTQPQAKQAARRHHRLLQGRNNRGQAQLLEAPSRLTNCPFDCDVSNELGRSGVCLQNSQQSP